MLALISSIKYKKITSTKQDQDAIKNFRKLKKSLRKVKNDSRNYKCHRSLEDKINLPENRIKRTEMRNKKQRFSKIRTSPGNLSSRKQQPEK